MTQTDDTRPVGASLEKRPTGRAAAPVVDAELVPASDDKSPERVRGTLEVLATRPLVGSRSGGDLLRSSGRTVYVAGVGSVSLAKRATGALTHAHLREQIRQARATGDRIALAEWSERLEDAKDARQKRILAMPKAALALAITGGVGVLLLAFLLLVGGIIAWAVPDDGISWTDWWGGVGGFVSGTWALIRGAFWVAGIAAVPLLFVLSLREGRRAGDPPKWLLSVAERVAIDAEITPSKVVTAMRDLGLPELRKAIKAMEDAGAAMLSAISLAGCGVEVDVSLPSGVSTDQIQDRGQRLAENLDRHKHELHITIPPKPRTVRLWIADSGALDEPVGPSPLVLGDTPKADIYTGRAPWGVSLRGDPVEISLKQCHVLVVGLSNQGKTVSARALVLWAIFDVCAEFRLADLKGIGDWHMCQPRFTTLIEGPGDEHVIAATEMLEAGVEEMERRLRGLDKEKYPDGVPRQLAREKGSGYHPLKLIVDEAQRAFMCPAVDEQGNPYGGTKRNSRFFNAARKLLDQGRAVNVVLWFFTQNPTDANLPKLIREAFHVRCSTVVGTKEQSRMALGDAAVDGGAAPHLLRKGIDLGVLVIAGDGVPLPPGQSSMTVRTHFINGTGAAGLVKSAMDLLLKRGRHLAIVSGDEPVDHLANVAEAVGDAPRLRTPVLLGALIRIDEDTYTPWSFQQLKAELGKVGVPVKTYNGDSVVRREDVLRALDARLVEPS